MPSSFNDHRFSFEALSYFTQNEYSGLALQTVSIFLSKSKEYITNFLSLELYLSHWMRWVGGLGIQTKNPANGRVSFLIVPGELVRAPLP